MSVLLRGPCECPGPCYAECNDDLRDVLRDGRALRVCSACDLPGDLPFKPVRPEKVRPILQLPAGRA